MDEKREALKFLGNLAGFLALLGLMLSFPLYVLLRSGELASPERMLRLQVRVEEPALVGLAYSNPDNRLKLEAARRLAPEVLALGNSRVLQFRAQFFKPGVRFYNAGWGPLKVRHLRLFMSRIPRESQPKVLILGLDHRFFDPSDPARDNRRPDDMAERLDHWPDRMVVFQKGLLKVWSDHRHGKFKLSDLDPSGRAAKLGLTALSQGAGFRADGSYAYGALNHGLGDAAQREDQYRHANIFGGDRPLGNAFSELGQFLDECRARGTHVVGFLPPYAHEVWERLRREHPENYHFKLAEVLAPGFARHGFAFFDFSDPAAFGSKDSEAVNWDHAGEKAHLRMFILMSENDTVLGKFVDGKALKERLRTAADDTEVFGNE